MRLRQCLLRRLSSSLVGSHEVEKTPITARLWAIRKDAIEKEKKLRANLPPSSLVERGATILNKWPHQSRVEVRYDFASNPSLKDLYIDTRGDILIGKLFEDLDSLAGTVSFVHAQDDDAQTLPPQLVTASCEQINLSRAIPARDLIMVGQVCWVGRSSMDVLVEIHEVTEGRGSQLMLVTPSPTRLLTSIFTYVSRCRVTGKSLAANRLLLPSQESTTSPEDQGIRALHQQRHLLAESRRGKPAEENSNANSGVGGEVGDAELAAKLLLRGRVIHDMPALTPPNQILMQLTSLENVVICQPQNVNTSGRVFGGFLIHRAYDLAEACTYMFAGAVGRLRKVDKISFKKPVDIGDLIRLKAQVVSCRGKSAAIDVTVQIVKPHKQESSVSNTFSFVFEFDEGVQLKEVLPLSQEEAALIVRASHRLEKN